MHLNLTRRAWPYVPPNQVLVLAHVDNQMPTHNCIGSRVHWRTQTFETKDFTSIGPSAPCEPPWAQNLWEVAFGAKNAKLGVHSCLVATSWKAPPVSFELCPTSNELELFSYITTKRLPTEPFIVPEHVYLIYLNELHWVLADGTAHFLGFFMHTLRLRLQNPNSWGQCRHRQRISWSTHPPQSLGSIHLLRKLELSPVRWLSSDQQHLTIRCQKHW